MGHLSILPNGLRRMEPCQILVIGGVFIFYRILKMSIDIKQEKYFNLEVEVEENTVIIYQKDSDIVISKDAAKQLVEILKDFIE